MDILSSAFPEKRAEVFHCTYAAALSKRNKNSLRATLRTMSTAQFGGLSEDAVISRNTSSSALPSSTSAAAISTGSPLRPAGSAKFYAFLPPVHCSTSRHGIILLESHIASSYLLFFWYGAASGIPIQTAQDFYSPMKFLRGNATHLSAFSQVELACKHAFPVQRKWITVPYSWKLPQWTHPLLLSNKVGNGPK